MSGHRRWQPNKKASLRIREDMWQSAWGYRLAIQDCLRDIEAMPGKGHGYGYIDALQDVQARLLDTLAQVERSLDLLNEQLANRRTP